MRYIISCMTGHRVETTDEEEALAFTADDSLPCFECQMPTFFYGSYED